MKTTFPCQYILQLLTFEYDFLGGGAENQGGEKTEAKRTNEQPLSDKPQLIGSGET